MTLTALAAEPPTAPGVQAADVPTPDPAMVAEHLTEQADRSPWVELRALDPLRELSPLSYWFNRETVDDAVRWAVAMNGTRRNLYYTINRIDTRPPEGQPAEDAHVARRRELLIDLDDPERPKGTGATDEGRAAVFAAGGACRDFLAGRGFGEPERECDSGNGLHLEYRIDLPPDDGGTVKRLLYALRARWPFVDVSVSNPSRICRVAGTMNWKGEPYRLCRTLERRSGAPPVPLTAMQAVIEELTPPTAKTETKRGKPASLPATKTDTTTPPRPAPAETPAEWVELLNAADNRGTVTVGGTAHPFDERFERAVKWVRSIPDDDLSRSGHGGHGRCYRHLRGLALGFLVRDRDALEELAAHYNGRLTATAERYPDRAAEFEPWEGRELAHKLDEALERPPDPDFPPGHLLPRGGGDAPGGFRPMSWNNPARLADEFTKVHDVLFVKDTAFRYVDGRYEALHDTSLNKVVRGFSETQAGREFDRLSREWEASIAAEQEELRDREKKLIAAPRDGGSQKEHDERDLERVRTQLTRLEKTRPGGVPPVTNKLVSETIAALRVRRQQPDSTPLDTWIDGSNRPPVLTVENGLLDPVARELHAPSSAWFSVIALPGAFDPAAPAPAKWLGYLSEVMEGDAERIAVLQEVAGMCLDPDPVKHLAFLAGHGENGKSAYLTALRALLGKPNVSAVELEKLSQSQFASSGLAGKLANIVGDQSFFESKDEAWLKTLTGGDVVRFEQKGKDPVFGVNRARLIFGCNTPPTIADKSEATWNRLVMVPFTYTVPADRRNPAMLTAEYWGDELSGILNWALDGLARLRANRGRLTRSAACEALKEKHRRDSNPARAFLLETCEPGQPGDYVRVDELFSAYQRWCGDGGYRHPLGKNRFGAVVRSVFPCVGDESRPRKIGAAVVRVWEGIRHQQDGNEVTKGNET